MKKGRRILCPKCNIEGLLLARQTKSKGKTYYYYATAHSKQSAISESGKRVHRIKWCYLNKEDLEKLQQKKLIEDSESVTQTLHKTKTPI